MASEILATNMFQQYYKAHVEIYHHYMGAAQLTAEGELVALGGRACAASLCERRLPTCCAEAAAAAPPRAAARAVVTRFEFRERQDYYTPHTAPHVVRFRHFDP